jgi:hypothetical protein
MVNPGEALLNVVTRDQRKMLLRWDQQVSGPVRKAHDSSGTAHAPPAKRRDLTHPVTAAERGKPVASPQGKANRKVRRWDCG